MLATKANVFLTQCAVVYISGEGGQGQLDGFFYGIAWYFVYVVLHGILYMVLHGILYIWYFVYVVFCIFSGEGGAGATRWMGPLHLVTDLTYLLPQNTK